MVDLGPVEPWLPPVLPWPPEGDGFIPVAFLLNPITGESIPMATETHIEDLDWFTRSWDQVFEVEWKVRRAELEVTQCHHRSCDLAAEVAPRE